MGDDDVIARIERLERQNRRLKGAGIALGVFACAGVLMGNAPPPPGAQKVEASSFVLVDEHGAKRCEIKLDSEGDAVLQLNAKDGTTRVELTARDVSGGEIAAIDGDGIMGQLSPTAVMVGWNNGASAGMMVTEADGAHLHLHDAQGNKTFSKP